jgi:hypothetical protein
MKKRERTLMPKRAKESLFLDVARIVSSIDA